MNKHWSVRKIVNLQWTSRIRLGVLAICYSAILVGAYLLAYVLRFDFEVPVEQYRSAIGALWWVIPAKLLILLAFGQFAGLVSYFSIPDLRRLLSAVGIGSFVLLVVRYSSIGFYAVPRGVLLLDFILSVVGLAGLRLGFRLIRERYLAPQSRPTGRARRVGIIGAGDVGASLARELLSKRGLRMHPVVFFDDDRAKWHSRVHDIPVAGAPEVLLDPKLNLQLEEIVIALPMAPAKRVGEIVRILQKTHLRFETVPSIDQLATGKVKVSQLRPVQIQDLLGRDSVELETESIREILSGRVVVVTGAGGSIGSELCRQISSFNPKRLLLLDRSEVQLFPIGQELFADGHGGIILPLVADICDSERIKYVFNRFQPEVVFHAAAHKHVPMMEGQPSEAIRNNTLGTVNLAELALEHGVTRFVLISTDKAINPTNVMGATKRLSEIFLQALHASQNGVAASSVEHRASSVQGKIAGRMVEPSNRPTDAPATGALTTASGPSPPAPRLTKFISVRFGNVLGSSGSVIPIFTKQIASGGPVTVTHPDVTRYFMTIPEAVGLVLQSTTQGLGGEIFVLDMGKPVKIVDLAKQLIELTGLRVDDDIEIKFTGLRPGEKLYEELSYQGENLTPTNHPKILRFISEPVPLKEVRAQIERLTSNLHQVEANQLKLMLQEAVPEYEPYLT